jgi:hypothetical protein
MMRANQPQHKRRRAAENMIFRSGFAAMNPLRTGPFGRLIVFTGVAA